MGPLFGALIARALDAWWRELGSPDPFVVIEVGAGNGRLAREILRAAPECTTALRYVLVERSETLRARQRDLLTIEPLEDALGPATPGEDDEPPQFLPGVGPIVSAIDELPAVSFVGVVIANELLDNLPFEIVQRSDLGWWEVRVGLEEERFVEVLVPAADDMVTEADALAADTNIPIGARLPIQRAAQSWIAERAERLRRGVLAVVDYGAEVSQFVGERQDWLRTYRAHERGGPPLSEPGSQDITADVVLEAVRHAAARAGLVPAWQGTQADWLRSLGITDLVDEGRARWAAGAQVGDLDALAARSRITEAAALTDPDGLGAHRVEIFRKVRI